MSIYNDGNTPAEGRGRDLRLTEHLLRALNSATKYPSIPTLHTMGERGVLSEPRLPLSGRVIVREKIDGTNVRIVLADRFLIGSRENLLHAEGDLCYNPAEGIVDAVRPIAVALSAALRADRFWLENLFPQASWTNAVVVYGECYGGKIGTHASRYTGTGATSFRVFDVAMVGHDILEMPVDRIAAWRDSGGQRFLAEDELRRWAAARGIEMAPLVFDGDAAEIPDSIVDVQAWLGANASRVQCAIDLEVAGEAEGVVIRSPDRSTIAKARFEDYRRTARAAGKARTP